jgi:PEP-CTERM motif
MKRFNVALLGASALSLLAPASVRAAAFIIDDTLPTEVIVFSANDFELGLTLDGNLFQQGNNNPAVATLPEGDANGPIVHHFDGRWITTGAAMPTTRQVAFLEPSDGSLSDVLFVQYIDQGNGFGRMVGSFVSDAGTGLNPSQYIDPLIPVINWPETNGPFNFSAPFLTALANSDADVPEPASLGLIAVGAGALILRRRASSRDARTLSNRRRA